MTRTPYAGFMASTPNPYGPTASVELDFVYQSGVSTSVNNNSINNTQMATQIPSNNNSDRNSMSKVLAHSTSLLANDSYIAGMSSDSELTSATTNRHHHRPYSSQSRVYHAHPGPRGSHASSRVSHYSDSAATYVPNKPPPAPSAASMQATAAQTPQTNQARHHVHDHQHISQQGSVSSSGSGGSAAYLGLADSPISPMLQQQQPGSLTRPSGRQLPHRPFKQSVSIDHHSVGQYHHHTQQQHQSPLQVGHLTSSPVQLMSSRFDPTNVYQHPQQSYPVGLIGQRQLVSGSSHSDARYAGGSAPVTAQRDFRFEMDMIEKQAESINLYDENASSAKMTAPAAAVGLSSNTAARVTSSRQLPATNPASSSIGSMSVDHLHHQIDQYHPSELQQQHQQHQKQFHQKQQELYASHQMTSSPADWLPPMGFTGQSHHGNRSVAGVGTQFKQTMSIDHYTTANQQHHYSPARVTNFVEHYRGPLGYASSSPVSGYESPTHLQHHHQHQHQQQQQQLAYQSASSDLMYKTTVPQDQVSQQSTFSLSSTQIAATGRNPQDSSIRDPNQCVPSNFAHSPARSAKSSQPRPNLQHQISSSSSNSQSGSLKSSSVDINRALLDHQKASNTTLTQFQQQPSPQHHKGSYDYHMQQQQQQQRQHAVLRKGYTSAVTGLTNSNTALNESSDFSTSVQTSAPIYGASGVYLSSHGGDKRSGLRNASPSMTLEATTSSSGIQQGQHHSSSSKADCGTRSESSTGLPNGAGSSSNLTKKSNSATQLSMTGTKKRLGFRKKQVTSFSVHRSEEVAPLEARHLVKQGSSVSEGDSSMSGDSSSRSWSNSNFKQPTSDELASMSFIDGLGKGQMISRQGLASPYLGDIQLSLCDRRGNLEIEVIRARNLQAKTNKILPLTYVKLYLVKNRKCLAKAKTTLSNKRTLDPLFQQQLTFHEDYHGCILQSIIWGNFGKMDKKNFMGIAQISIDDLELSDTVISWYKLFLPSSLQTLPSKSLRHTLLSNSTESFTNTNNS